MGELRTLASGARVHVDPMPGLETAALGFWFDAGAIDESKEENGVAHLLEHMAFKGTKKRTARAIVEEIENVGGYLNAATGYQRTGYYARVMKEDVALAVDVISDVLTNPLFEEKELKKEREVVVQEIGEANDTPDDAVSELLQTIAFDGQPLGRPILGSIESVRSHTRCRLAAFMNRLYAPDRLVVAAAGAVDPDAFTALVEHAMAAPARAAAPKRPVPAYGGGARHDARDIDQTHISMAFPAASSRDRDYVATRVLTEALGGGMASRLFQSIREERGLAYSVYAFADTYDEVGALGAYVGTDQTNALEAVTLVRAGLEEMTQSIADDEIARAKAMLKASMLMAFESPLSRAETAAAHLFTYGEALSPHEMARRLDAVTAEDVRRCAERALGGAPCLAVVGPAPFAKLERAIGGR